MGNSLDNRLQDLIEIGVALSSAATLSELFELILSRARTFTNADAGTLYVREADELVFKTTQNDTLDERDGPRQGSGAYKRLRLPISDATMAGATAQTAAIINIPDAYAIGDRYSFTFSDKWDKEHGYRTESVLCAPMLDRTHTVIGVLQLLNARAPEGAIKAFDPDLEPMVQAMANQAGVALENLLLAQRIKEAHLDTIQRLAIAAEYKDEDTANHIRRMSNYSTVIAFHMGHPPEFVENLLYASPMHDVGKLGVPDAILLKPGPLTPEERRVMEKHTVIDAKLLSGSDSEILQMSEVVALTHHEKWDGTGYPAGLKGNEIPIEGRIVALADVFDALCSKRCYKPAFPFEKSMAIINEGRGKHFDPAVVDAFHRGLAKVTNVHRRYSD